MNAEQTFPTTQNDRDVHEVGERLTPSKDLIEYLRQFARERPEFVALWCLGIGFVLGWKLKPW